MEEYERDKAAGLLALRAFPRSFGMLVGAGILVLTVNPVVAIQLCIYTWFVLYLGKLLLITPNFIGTYLWSCLSTPILLVSAWPVKWLI